MIKSFFTALLLLAVGFSDCGLQLVNAQDVYKVGVGIADATGPAAEINMVNPFRKWIEI